MRHVILHHHIFKNAGSTLDFTLKTQLGPRFASLDEDTEHGRINKDNLIDFLHQEPNVLAVSSHHFHCQDFREFAAERGFCLVEFALVRKPITRLISMYQFYRSIPSSDRLALAAKNLGRSEFLSLMIERHPHLVNSPQVNIFANHGFYCRPVDTTDVQNAWRRFSSFALCGTVERYDHSMVTLEYFYTQLINPRLNLAYVTQNVSQKISGEADLPDVIHAENRSALDRLTAADEQLWQLANSELDRRIGMVPDFEQRLEDFRRRCDEMRTAYSASQRDGTGQS